ncbi:hypothetical protein A2331_01175 [Candidatus Falkowbacteria bacterium RIFOXYB2_FULL_34_18]|uniref:SbsA Ig-like domain-containing protein n=1 Tax=Candidatus Falkowbacteria bacterium RIFOXYD2_FULL_34_120 TaxID=1798007 RepID=A0A1F5TPE5_9BACT|nr:MAG: hypothetical protein A2331_01175 [Candidatus Falkowbacteria bacterium RIFOXYB2_FULL_34_18]OGF29126.1 MAG: hypothetical protein A2500_02785 [Candidatus Falkowbacteria bacterium RIFOXYC12_FULL_34_55]OGF36222.1 MAG: hypothetical protein A2466_04955 [Candidatus Falkowbacteria bacterium RIFOXYC2_FULL_34_220]OGF38636.1 MAG: hypothetical protein A2515_06915 [Candidatus Falkowbacteria bacterium RIFOXYD12_FULL_34_57]OGF40825.1 MAG: hypothetical protein A2531_06620 [Candidatus Falkowbacteria bact
MFKKFLPLIAAIFILSAISAVSSEKTAKASNEYNGQLVRMNGLSSLYYVAGDGKRYVFPNEKIYNSWFTNFDDVITLSQDELTVLPLGGNVLYRPGALLVKITTDPKVYAVSTGGVLRWIKTEAAAKALYGDSWAKLIDDVPDSFFTNYKIGDDIDDISDFDPNNELENTDSIDANHGLSTAHALQAHTRKCQFINNSRNCGTGSVLGVFDDGKTPSIKNIQISNQGKSGYIDLQDKITINFSEAIDPKSINSYLTAGDDYTTLDNNITGSVSVSLDGVVTIKGIASFDAGEVEDSGNFSVTLSLSSSGKSLTATLIAGTDIEISDEDFEDAAQIAGTVKDLTGNVMEDDDNIGQPSGTFGGKNINDGIEPFISAIEAYNGGNDDYIDIKDEIRITFSERIDGESINKNLIKGGSVDDIEYDETGGVSVDDDGILTVKNIARFYVGDVEDGGKFIVSLALDSEGKVLTAALKSGEAIALDNENLDDAKQIGGKMEDRDGNEMVDDPNINDPSGSFVENTVGGTNPYITYIKIYNYGYKGFIDIDDQIVITFSEEIDPKSINNGLSAGGTVDGIDLDETGGVYIDNNGIFTVTDILSFDVGEVKEGSYDLATKLSLSSNAKILTITITGGDSVEIKTENFSQIKQFGDTLEDENGDVMKTEYDIDNPNGTFGGDSTDTPPYIASIEIKNGNNADYIDIYDTITITFNEKVNPKSIHDDLKLGGYVRDVDDNDTGGVIVEDDGTLTISDIARFYVGSIEDDSEFEVKLSLNSTGNILTITLTDGDNVEINYEDFGGAEQTSGAIKDEDGNEMENDPRIDDPTGSF